MRLIGAEGDRPSIRTRNVAARQMHVRNGFEQLPRRSRGATSIGTVALSEQDKQRIREEEEFRLSVRAGLSSRRSWHTAVPWVVLVAITILLIVIAGRG